MVGGLIAIGLIGIAIWIVLLLINLPSASSQLPPGSAALKVDLFLPENGAGLPAGAYASVQAEALGVNPITTVQFWVDGIPVDASSAGEGVSTNTLNANWAWLPASEGAHILVARAEDDQGNAGLSNPVRVVVTAQDTAEDVSNDALPDFLGISTGQTSTQGLPPAPPLPAPGQFAPAPSGAPNPAPMWFAMNIPFQAGLSNGPAAPQLAVAVNGCSVNLYIYDKSQNETGFFVYRMGPADSSFNRIVTLDASNGPVAFQYVDAGGFAGTSQYYVSSFNAGGETAGNIVQAILTDANCPSAFPSGPQFSNPKMTVSEPIDQLYCYLSFDNGDWVRIPAGMDSFVFPNVQGEFDLSPYLGLISPAPLTKDAPLELACWGWSGGVLQDLGKAQATLKPGQTGPLTISGDKFQLVVDLLDQAPPPGGNSPPEGGGGGMPSPDMLPPYGVELTADGAVCTKHSAIPIIFALVCNGAVKTEKVVLVWNWMPYVCFPGSGASCQPIDHIDGYRVYNGWSGALLDTISDQKQTVSILTVIPSDDPAHPSLTPCFIVKAFKGDLQSGPSETVCFPTPPNMKHVTLNPIQTVTSKWENTADFKSDKDCGTAVLFPDHTKLTVGYENDLESTKCYDSYHSLLLGRAQFDLGAAGVSADKLQSAILHTVAVDRVSYDGVVNCAFYLERVNMIQGITDTHENMDLSGYWNFVGNALNVDLPATSLVKSWLQSAQPGKLNQPSFALVPADYGSHWPHSCVADYTVSLELISYP